MTRGAITFDFHNTLARCDRWFQLETRELPAAFLSWRAGRDGAPAEVDGDDARRIQAARDAHRRLRLAIIDHGRELSAEACVAVVLDELGIAASADEIAQGVATLMRDALDEVSPTSGAVETVRALAAVGVPLGVVSSAVYHPFLEWSLARFGLGGAFGVVTTSASAGFYKSHPEIYWSTLSALGAAPECSIHVGDSLRFDVGGAQRAGMRTAWIADGVAATADEPRPDLTVSSLAGAAPHLLDLLGASSN